LKERKHLNMKKFFTMGLLALSVLVAYGQAGSGAAVQWGYQSFITPMANSVTVSNKFMGITNLLSLQINGAAIPNRATNSTGAYATNVWGTSFTNNMGLSSMVTNNAALTNTFGTYETLNLLQDVNLYPDRNATRSAFWPSVVVTALSNSVGAVYIKLIGQGSVADSAVNFYFTPLPDGTNEVSINEEFVVGVTATGLYPASIYTNVPNRFANCRGFRLRAVDNTDTTAASRIDLLRCGFISFGP
jgi:hypothetical protein